VDRFNKVERRHFAILIFAVLLAGFNACTESYDLKNLNVGLPEESLYKKIEIQIKDYCPQEGFSYVDFYALHYSGIIDKNKFALDDDRDGITNYFDSNIDFNIVHDNPDSNGDGYSDLAVFRGGFYSDQQLIFSCNMPFDLDSDLDQITDCEEELFNTNPFEWDSDFDTIPDSLEIRTGLNPLDPEDPWIDSDLDGIPNIIEIKHNTPIYSTNSLEVDRLTFKFNLQPYVHPTGIVCVDMNISNISVLNVPNGNQIQFFFIEENIPDDPNDETPIQRNMIPKSVEFDTEIDDGSILEFPYSEL